LIGIFADGIVINKIKASLRITPGGDRKAVKFYAWDLGGQEVYYTSHQFFINDGALYLVVWNICNAAEASRVDYWIQSILRKV